MHCNSNNPADENSISEKWEGLAQVPLYDPSARNEFLLLVGNDNDFKAGVVYHNGHIVGTNSFVWDTMILAYLVHLPIDNTPPIIDQVSADPATIWPPNNKLVPVTIDIDVTDNFNFPPRCRLSNVASNEELNAGDVQITGDLSLLLRASRTGRGNGRNYDLTVECTDGAGNQTTAGVMIRVPHD